MKSFLLIDIGASRIKYCSYSKESDMLSKVFSVDFPKSSNLDDHEIILNDVSEIFNEIIYNETKRENIDHIFICSQMHGFILKDRSDNFISNFISWKDERASIFSSKHSKSFIDLFKNFNENFQDISGIKPRVGLPVISIFAMENKKMIPPEIKVYNLPEFLIENLAGYCNGSHKTLSQSFGFHSIDSNKLSSEVLDTFNTDIKFNDSLDNIDIVSKMRINDSDISFLSPIGDLQSATYGILDNLKNNILINLGTGSQVISLKDNSKTKNPFLENRSFFEDYILDVKSHYPCGRAIEIYIKALNNFYDKNYWDEMSKLKVENILASKKVNLSIFKTAENFKEFNISILKNNTHKENIEILNGMIHSLVDQFGDAIGLMRKSKVVNNILLAGGVAHKLPFLKEVFNMRYNLNTEIIYIEDETILGMKKLIKTLKF